MFCSSCGFTINENERFCTKCGMETQSADDKNPLQLVEDSIMEQDRELHVILCATFGFLTLLDTDISYVFSPGILFVLVRYLVGFAIAYFPMKMFCKHFIPRYKAVDQSIQDKAKIGGMVSGSIVFIGSSFFVITFIAAVLSIIVGCYTANRTCSPIHRL